MWNDEEKLQFDKYIMENELDIVKRHNVIAKTLAQTLPPEDNTATALLLSFVTLVRQRGIHVKDAQYVLRQVWELDEKTSKDERIISPAQVEKLAEPVIDAAVRATFEAAEEEESESELKKLREEHQQKAKEELQ